MKLHRQPAWALLLCAGVAVAQDEAPPASEPLATIPVEETKPAETEPKAEKSDAVRFEDVVVTSTKFKENARQVVGGITVLRGEDLAEKNYQDAADFLKLVPGVNLTGGGDPFDPKRITVRGISNISGTTMTSGTFWGDVPFSDPYIARVTLDPNTFDLETVEVLKGPQGTLFGASALNGAVRYVPKAPEFGHWGFSGFAQGDTVVEGSPGWTYGAAANIPVSGDDAALRVVGFNRAQGGYIDETGRGQEDINSFRQYGYRGLFAWQITDRWRVDLGHTEQDARSNDSSFANGRDGRLERDSTPLPSTATTHYRISSASLTRRFDFGEFVTTYAWLDKRFEAVRDLSRNYSVAAIPGQDPPPLAYGTGPNHSNGYTLESRLVYDPGDSSWRWILGVFSSRMAMFEDNHSYTATGSTIGLNVPAGLLQGLPLLPIFIAPNGEVNLGGTAIDVAAVEQAVFGELRRKLFEDFEAAVAARVFRTRVGGWVNADGAAIAAVNSGNPELRYYETVEEKGVNPSFSFSWKPNRSFIAFLQLARGFRTGGLNPLSNDATVEAPRTYKSDFIDNAEIGWRSSWFSGLLLVDGGLYYLEWKDPQLFQQPDMSFSQYIDNVGGAKGMGAELAIAWRVPFIPGLSLNAAASLSRTQTSEEFVDVSGTLITPGTDWPYAPRFQSTEGIKWTHLFGGTFETTIGFTHTYIGKAYADLTHADPVFDFHVLDAQLSLHHLMWKALPQVDLTVSNLLDSRGWTALESLGGTLPTEETQYSPTYIRPRSLGLRVTWTFE